METTKVNCECDSRTCVKSVRLPVDEALNIVRQEGLYVIVDGCSTGPSPTDKLVERRNGYSLYKEG